MQEQINSVNIVKSWCDGYNNYKQHSIVELLNNRFYHKLILREEKPIYNNWLQIIGNYLYGINKIDLLYSGGIDSEFALLTCKKLNKQVNAVTMKITNKDIIYNQYELDYSSKFCKNNNIKQKIVKLDVSFYDNGDFIKYVEPYKIKKANIAAHFWLINQCDNFPIIGGNYFWVKENNFQKCLSPMSYGSLFHDIYMKENNIKGIGNLLNYGYNGVHLLMNAHLTSYKKNMDLGKLKQIIYSNLLNEDLEIRQPKHGFEGYEQKYLNSQIRNIESITWGYYTCELLNTNNTTNGKR